MNSELNYEGLLFDSVKFKSYEDVQNLIEGITEEQAFFFLTKALEFSQARGIYNLTESELISKSLRVLFKKTFQK